MCYNTPEFSFGGVFLKRPLGEIGKKIVHGVSMSALFALSLAIALFTTSIAPTMFRQTMAEDYIPPAPVVAETETQAPETTTEVLTTEATTAEETTKKTVYKANTDVKTQVATGDKKKDEDKGNDKVKDESLTSSGSGESLPEYDPTPLPPADSGLGVKSKYSDFVYADSSTLTGWQNIGGVQFYFNNNHRTLTGMQKIGDRNYYFNTYGAKASLVGIDVSQWNGTINWSKVKADGIDFAIIRVGFRGYGTSGPKPVTLDKNVETNIVNAKKAGIAVGLYFFSQAITINEALEEAGACVNIARKYGIQYPIYFDTEYSNPDRDGRADSLSKSERTNIAVAFCEAVKNAGYAPGVYASKSFYDDELIFSRLSSYNIWVAHYTSKNTDFRHPYKIWQYSEKGKVSGISYNTDMNISLYDYAKKSDMKNLGSNVILTDSAGLKSYTLAEAKLAAYEQTPTDAIYKDTFSTISALPNARVKTELLEKLEEFKKAAETTSAPTTAVTSSDA